MGEANKPTALTLNLQEASTFDPAIAILSKAIQDVNKLAFDNVTLNKNVTILAGQRVPVVTGNDDPTLPTYGYMISMVLVPTDKFRMILVVNMGSPNSAITAAEYTANFSTGDNHLMSFTQTANGNLLIITFDLQDYAGTDLPFDINGGISLSDSSKMVFSTSINGKSATGVLRRDIKNPEPAIIRYGIKRVGIDDYRKVEQEVCCYDAGEVSHIENVMAREYKERSTRLLRRTEDTTTTEKSTESEKLTDTSSTDRFEMQQQTAKALSESTAIGINATVTYDQKPVSATLSGSYAHNTTQQESNSQAVNFSKEITQKATEKIVQKVREERIIKIIDEFEEQNKHGFDNRQGDVHLSGVYRWIDKIYKNQVFNYGKRLIYEFMIPQPAVFHNEAMKVQSSNVSVTLPEPIDPRVGDGYVHLDDFHWVTSDNYAHWGAIYNVELEAPPAAWLSISKSFGGTQVGADEQINFSADIEIPEGYVANFAAILVSALSDNANNAHYVAISAGTFNWAWEQTGSIREYHEGYLNPTKSKVQVSFISLNYLAASVFVEIRVSLSTQAYEQWQIKTFNAIIKAYEEKKAAFDRSYVEEVSRPTNPGFYRTIENTILRKCCISYLVSHDKMGKDAHYIGGDLTQITPMQDAAMEDYSSLVKFIEQAFEWEILSYTFYPFYWAHKADWSKNYLQEVDDPIFRAFLQSGMARTFVSVRPGFEEAVMYFMATGQIWNGGPVPVIGDDLYLSIVEELKNPTYYIEETWETRVPTTLTAIQSGTVSLDATGLPCSCGDMNDISAGTVKLEGYPPAGTPT